MSSDKAHFCHYCRTTKADPSFRYVVHAGTGSKRRQCTSCRVKRQRPRHELEADAATEREARRQLISEATKKGIAMKKEKDRDFT